MVEHFPPDVMGQYSKPCFTLFFQVCHDEEFITLHSLLNKLIDFQRLTSSKTTKFIKSFLVFSSLYAVRFGGQALVDVVDSIQANMFGMVCDRLFIPEVQKVTENLTIHNWLVFTTDNVCFHRLAAAPRERSAPLA